MLFLTNLFRKLGCYIRGACDTKSEGTTERPQPIVFVVIDEDEQMHWNEFATDRDNLIVGQPGPCFTCGKMTPWIEINLEGYLCSTACSEKVDAELKAMQQERHEAMEQLRAEVVPEDLPPLLRNDWGAIGLA